MNTTLQPVLQPSTQSSTPSPNKPMHPQGAPVSYAQPSGPVPQNPYPNTNMAHSHANAQQNHFSLGVPAGGYSIPASNHPVASLNQSAGGQQPFTAQKNAAYSAGFPNAGHGQNQNTIPPVSQSLPANPVGPQQIVQNVPSTQSQNSTPVSTPTVEPPVEKEKPQANGTPEKAVPQAEVQGNHVTPAVSITPVSSSMSTAEAPQTSPPKPPQPTTVLEKPDPPKPAETPKLAEDAPPPATAAEAPKPAPTAIKPAPQAQTAPKIAPQAQTAPKIAPTAPKPAPQAPTASKPAPQVVAADLMVAAATEEGPPPQETPKDAQETDPLAIDTPPVEEEKVEDTQETGEDSVEESNEEEATKSPPAKKEAAPAKAGAVAKTPIRKAKTAKVEAKPEPKTPVQKSPNTGKVKRQRMMTQHYQSPLPEIEIITKISSSTPRSRNMDDKLIYFYKNEFLAVRNAEGSFYLCQAMQNVYKSSSKIKIRWLSQDKFDNSGEIYAPDFYDLTDFDCILTSLDLTRVDKGKYRLKPAEKERTDSILKRCLAVEKGEIVSPSLSEEHPDGLDLSLYKDEEQLKKKRKGLKRKGRPRSVSPKKAAAPAKKTPEAPKVRKVEPKPAAKKKPAPAAASAPRKAPTARAPAAAANDGKKTAAGGRASRGGNRKIESRSPVMDQKKAIVLAKIGRSNAAGQAAAASRSHAKSAKPSKPVPSTSKSTKVGVAATSSAKAMSLRKPKRSTRK